jgi:hypothetical protein
LALESRVGLMVTEISGQWNRKLTQMEAMRGKMEFLPDAGQYTRHLRGRIVSQKDD